MPLIFHGSEVTPDDVLRKFQPGVGKYTNGKKEVIGKITQHGNGTLSVFQEDGSNVNLGDVVEVVSEVPKAGWFNGVYGATFLQLKNARQHVATLCNDRANIIPLAVWGAISNKNEDQYKAYQDKYMSFAEALDLMRITKPERDFENRVGYALSRDLAVLKDQQMIYMMVGSKRVAELDQHLEVRVVDPYFQDELFELLNEVAA